jgi:hypothetical protein
LYIRELHGALHAFNKENGTNKKRRNFGQREDIPAHLTSWLETFSWHCVSAHASAHKWQPNLNSKTKMDHLASVKTQELFTFLKPDAQLAEMQYQPPCYTLLYRSSEWALQ